MSKYHIDSLDYEDFKNYAGNFDYAYNMPAFLETLNQDTANIEYLSIGNKKVKAALFLSKEENQFKVPFSAPFWNIEKIKKTLSIQSIDAIVKTLCEYFDSKQKNVSATLPPAFYDEKYINTILNSFHNSGFEVSYFDLNYHFDLNRIKVENYVDSLDPNARRNLRIADSKKLRYEIGQNKEDFSEAYQVIKENREFKNYPLRLSEQQLYKTLNALGGDVFIIKEKDKIIASAFIYNINDTVKQLIYWGDKPGFEDSKAINYLSYSLITHYYESKYKYIDLGPASDEGVPNLGLANFKESIGAFSSLKTTIKKQYK